MGVIPQKTTPLTKFVRTGEGVLVFAFNLAMLIVPIVSSALTPEEAVKWAGIVNGVAVISRTGLKIVAEVSKTTGIAPQPIGNVTPQVITADTSSSASNGGGPEAVTDPVVTAPIDPVVTAPIDPVVTAPTDPVVVAGDPTDAEEFQSGPTADDDAVDVPAAPVVTPAATTQSAPADSTDPQVSDEEEFSSVPPLGEDDDDSTDASAVNGAGAMAEELEPAVVGVPSDPVVTDGGGGHLS